MKNRKEEPLPTVEVKMKIQLSGGNQGYPDFIYGVWTPFNPKNYTEVNMPSEGYLGTFRDNVTKHGFHAWEQNQSEFIYYEVLEQIPEIIPAPAFMDFELNYKIGGSHITVTFDSLTHQNLDVMKSFYHSFMMIGGKSINSANKWYFPTFVSSAIISKIIENTCFRCGGVKHAEVSSKGTYYTCEDCQHTNYLTK